jgi:hypothetical protein
MTIYNGPAHDLVEVVPQTNIRREYLTVFLSQNFRIRPHPPHFLIILLFLPHNNFLLTFFSFDSSKRAFASIPVQHALISTFTF